jgi:hypothetical protein
MQQKKFRISCWATIVVSWVTQPYSCG